MSQIILSNVPPAIAGLPENILAILRRRAAENDSGMVGMFGNTMKAGRVGVELTVDGDTEVVPYGQFAGICLRTAPEPHAVWYSKAYVAGQNSAPDLVWKYPKAGTFPEALPASAREKQQRDGGRTSWAFQIKRRTVWVRFIPGQGVIWDTKYVFDLPATTLYGNNRINDGKMSWRDLSAWTHRLGIAPCCVAIAVFPDPSQPIGGVLFQPNRQANGAPTILDIPMLTQVIEESESDEVANLCTVEEKLTWQTESPRLPGQADQQSAPQPQPQQPQPAPAQQPQPQTQQPQPQPQQPQPQPKAKAQPAQSTADLVNTAANMLNNQQSNASQTLASMF